MSTIVHINFKYLLLLFNLNVSYISKLALVLSYMDMDIVAPAPFESSNFMEAHCYKSMEYPFNQNFTAKSFSFTAGSILKTS